MSRRILLSSVLVFLSLFIISAFSVNQARAWATDTQSLKKAPDFSLSDINGNPLRLSDFKGKVVLLDFWATWCPFCRKSIPIFNSLYDEYKDKGLVIIGIALEYDKSGRALKEFVEQKDIGYPVAIGSEKLAIEYGAYGVPTRFFINRQGEIVEKFIGFQGKEVFEPLIKELLKLSRRRKGIQ